MPRRCSCSPIMPRSARAPTWTSRAIWQSPSPWSDRGMTIFSFATTPSILSGPGAIGRLAEVAGTRLGARVLVVTDRGLVAAGIVGPVTAALEAVGIAVAVFDAVAAEPPESDALAAAEAARAHDATGVLGLGGGSPMDVAKVAALLAGSGEPLDDAYGVGNARGPRLPVALVPTTAGDR